MLSILFNKNKRKWFSQLSDQPSKDMEFIIVNFFIKDNISVEQYIDNQLANDIITSGRSLTAYEMANSLSLDSNKRKNLNPSRSFKKYFGTIDRPLGLSDWFIIGYPDVAGYFIDNLEKLEEEFNQRENEFLDANGRLNFKCYRYLIDKFKTGHSLELKIK